MSSWIDISVPLTPGIPQWPGDPTLSMWMVAELQDGANVTAFSMCAHTGTHMDAPLHYVENGKSVDDAPLDVLIGPAIVSTLDGNWRGAQRVLFQTSNSDQQWWRRPFDENFASISPQLATELVAAGVRLVGIDYLSVGANNEEGSRVHRILLEAGIWLLEGLNLTHVETGSYDLICLPIRLAHSDGAPARAIIQPTLAIST